MRPNGGQLNVTGILYQMLVSLAEGLDATVTAVAGTGGSTVVIQPEPFDGGDVQIDGVAIQIKRRSSSRHWSVGDIIREVLPDLIKAVDTGKIDRFQFVTDNDKGCGDFRDFLAWYRCTIDSDAAPPTPRRFKLGRGKEIGPEAVLAAIPGLVKIEPTDLRLPILLASLEIVQRSEIELEAEIKKPLGILLEQIEDVTNKLDELLGKLVRLGRDGSATTTAELLRSAQLDPRRLVHAGQLAATLREELTNTFPAFRYEPDADVRVPLPAPGRPVTVLRGESGLGKTWRLCLLARTMADAGKPVILLRASSDVDRLAEKIASQVWNPIYNAALPLRSIAHRLQPALGDDRGVWLTVFLDDLNDPELAQAILEAGWDRFGIDIVCSSQPMTAKWLEGAPAAPEIVEVPEFTWPEMINYLERHGVDSSTVQDDVLELLLKPILATLYCKLPHGILVRPETEYELLQSFWNHATTDRPLQLRHAFDLDRLELLVGDMLAEPPVYPWPPSAFARILDYEAVERLTLRGLIEIDGRRHITMTHDRLLNWTMARYLGEHARDRDLTPRALHDLLKQAMDLTTVSGIRIGGRLGYVLMDLLWLLMAPGAWSVERVAQFLLERMRAPDFDASDRVFFSQTLPTLGRRGVSLICALIEQPFHKGRETHWPGWLATGLRNVAVVAWDEVREAATQLFRSGEPVRIEAALTVFAKVPAPDLLDELHALNLKRVRSMNRANANKRVSRMQAKERSFEALAGAAGKAPAWLDARIAASTGTVEAEQLLWVLLRQRRCDAQPIWVARRYHLFETIRNGARVLPSAVRAFADPADLSRLRLSPPTKADTLYDAVTFDALSRLDPDRAIEILRIGTVEGVPLDLRSTENWWMPWLHLIAGPHVSDALRARYMAPNAADQLARAYASDPELMEPATVDVLLNGLELILTSRKPAEERLRLGWRLLSVLSSARTAAAISQITARRGTRFERALAKVGALLPPKDSRVLDRDGRMIARLLAMMAGDGYDALVLAQITSTGVTTQEYGFGHALWTDSSKVADALGAKMLKSVGAGEDRPYHLMQALAAHGLDEGLVRLIGNSSPVYTDAVEIRRALSGDTVALEQNIRSRLAINSEAAWLQAVDLAHFLPAELALDLTAPLIARAAPGDDLAKRLLMLHYHYEHYEPAMLQKLRPFLDAKGGDGGTAAAHFASVGDAVVRGEALRWLTNFGLGESQWIGVQIAIKLLDHEETRESAFEFLTKLRTQLSGFGRLDAEILDALARHGDNLASEQLVNLSYGSGSRDLNAVAGAVRIASRRDAPTAFHAARRLFAQTGQQEAARLLMETDPDAGMATLMAAYIGASLDKRLFIARALRWKAPMDRLVPALAALASAPDEEMRQIAAEIGGWLPVSEKLPWLQALARDPVRDIQQAGLTALQRRAADVAGLDLMELIPTLRPPAQWACLRALIDLVDPHVLSEKGDPLDIRPTLEALPSQFRIEADRVLTRQRQDVDKKATQEAAREAP